MILKTLLLFTMLITFNSCSLQGIKTPTIISENSYSQKEIDSKTIRVLVWNVHKENKRQKLNNEFKELLESKKPSIIMLQEFSLQKKISTMLSEEFNYGWEFAPNLYEQKYKTYSGLLLASKTKPNESVSILSKGHEPFSGTPKLIQYALYPLKGKNDLLVINIHSLNFQITTKLFVEQLDDVIAKISSYDGPVILAGDFNTWSEARVDYLNKITKKMNLKEVDFKNDTKHIKHMFSHQIDHIFYSDDFFEVIEQSEDVLEDIKSSDHRALFVELMFK